MKKKKYLNVLIACEESQTECAAFRSLGHHAYSCDIQPCRPCGNPAWHIHGDVRPFLNGKTDFHTQDRRRHRLARWDLIIAHPPCTFLTRMSAVRMNEEPLIKVKTCVGWRRVNKNRWINLKAGRAFFYTCLRANCRYLAVENPIPLAIANLPRPNSKACPSWFGSKYTKKTLYWLKNLPDLIPTIFNTNTTCLVKAKRGKYRSQTDVQLAAAIAHQWGEFVLAEINKKTK